MKTTIVSQELSMDLQNLPLHQIAGHILSNWSNPYFGARPYIQAMLQLSSVDDDYGYDSGRSVVLYFLANAQTWRGPVAKAVKAELRRRTR